MRASLPHLTVLALLANAACSSAGTDLAELVNESSVSDGGADASVSASVDAGLGNPAKFTDPFAGAPAYVATTIAPSHNVGLSCIGAGCHAQSGTNPAPNFLFGGTVFADYKGTAPAPGVEVRAVDSVGNVVSVFTGPEGNFYLPASAVKGLSFPLVVGARNATTTRPMITTVTASSGSCGQKACHVRGGGSPDAGAYYPIHVP
jgi:hypothetical protein